MSCFKEKCFIYIKKTFLKMKQLCFENDWKFLTTDLLRVTLVSVKESWGIRISLNAIRSTQVFNEILFYLKVIFNKNVENKFRQNKFLIMFLNYICEFPKMDSYYVTVVSGRKSWGTICRIKYFDFIRDV